MKTLEEIKEVLRDQLPYLREHYGVHEIGICGSYARGDQTTASDIDLLVTFTQKPGMFEFVNLKRYLEGLLDAEVDLTTPDALREGPGSAAGCDTIFLDSCGS